jgi:addiction module HigA family antidote
MQTKLRTIAPAHPGEILHELYLTPLGISITKLAEALGVSRKAVSHIVNKHKSVTPEMALRLSGAFPNTSAGFWLNLQKNYDLWHAQQKSQEWQQITPLFSPPQEILA